MSTSLAGLKDNPVTRDLVVDDADYDNSDVYKTSLNEVADAIGKYTAVMMYVADNCSGAAADNLRAYANKTAQTLQGILEGIGNRLSVDLTRYINEIDAADSKLY